MKNKYTLIAMAVASISLLHAEPATDLRAPNPQTIKLTEHNKEFKQEVIQVAPNVYVACGYDVSNLTMIEGDDGLILVDVGMIPEITEKVLAQFRKISDKPIKAIILTHGHGDHTQGITPFLQGEKPLIFAAENFGVEDIAPREVGLKNPRAHRQSGMALPPEERINNGIAPARYPHGKNSASDSESAGSIFAPFDAKLITDYVSEPKKRITIAGVTLDLIRADGETADHLVVYYPEQKLLFPGDLFYKSFPNLYAIRGGIYRDVRAWVESLDMMIDLGADKMVMGHTRPILGADEVKRSLTQYRDAIAFVFDKTIEGINLGLTPDELVAYVQLPERLGNDPQLQQFYGRVEWAVRNIFNGYLGWFDGNATTLSPLPPQEEASQWLKLLGGEEVLLKAAQDALSLGDYQWAAELSDRLLALQPDNQVYRHLKADALYQLGEHTETATGRNYYKTAAQELRSDKTP